MRSKRPATLSEGLTLSSPFSKEGGSPKGTQGPLLVFLLGSVATMFSRRGIPGKSNDPVDGGSYVGDMGAGEPEGSQPESEYSYSYSFSLSPSPPLRVAMRWGKPSS
jgi:hypothetical protein